MHDNGVTLQKKVLQNLDIPYSYELAKRMEQYRSHPTLGYRPAGSKAEFEPGEMLKTEMGKIGLSEVTKDAVTVDGWEFHKAALSYTNAAGETVSAELGAYQTTFVTDGPKEFSMMYLGKGTETDYQGKDVRDKLVLVEINQRDEWWINYPVYQAHLKGAAALIAVQSGGYGEIDDEALNAQDIAGPEDAPAFSISRKDAAGLLELLRDQEEITVTFDAESRVTRNCTTYNIVGKIPGKHPDRMVLLSAHYDSYFDGFQDDNTAVALMFGIAKALRDSGFQPNNTIVICAMASEEWGVVDSNFDWSTGAYEQIFTAHPEWVGKVIADLNFELPALAHGTRARIRSCYEYVSFLEEYLADLPNLTIAYPEETAVTSPIETWSDDFSVAISGIPSMVNEFSSAEFMETHYHSQFDNDEYYNADVFQFHHELYGLLVMAFDRVKVAPVNVGRTLQALQESVRPVTGREDEKGIRILLERTAEAKKIADAVYKRVKEINEISRDDECNLRNKYVALQRQLLYLFRKCQDYFVRLNWHDEVLFPHEAAQSNLRHIGDAVRSLENKDVRGALDVLYLVDNNQYAFQFDDEVYHYFTEYVLNQEKDRLQWGAGRIVHHVDLSKEVKSLKKKIAEGGHDVTEELCALKKMEEEQLACFDDDIRYMTQAVDTLTDGLKKAKEVLDF